MTSPLCGQKWGGNMAAPDPAGILPSITGKAGVSGIGKNTDAVTEDDRFQELRPASCRTGIRVLFSVFRLGSGDGLP